MTSFLYIDDFHSAGIKPTTSESIEGRTYQLASCIMRDLWSVFKKRWAFHNNTKADKNKDILSTRRRLLERSKAQHSSTRKSSRVQLDAISNILAV